MTGTLGSRSGPVHASIAAAGCNQPGMRTPFDYLAAFDHDDAVGTLDSRCPMRDNEHRLFLCNRFDGIQNSLLTLGVEVRGRLVQYEQRPVPQHCAGNGNTLSFAAGEPLPPLADHGAETVGQLPQQFPECQTALKIDPLSASNIDPLKVVS